MLNKYTNKISRGLKFLKYAYDGYRWQIIVITILGFIGGLTGGLGIGMLIPLFSFVAGEGNTYIPNTFQHFLKGFFAFFHLGLSLPLILVLMVVLFVIKAAVSVLVDYISEKVSAQYLKNISSSLFNKTLMADWPFLINQKVGHLDRIISGDASCAASILRTSSNMMLQITSLITYTFIAFKISAPIALLSLIFGGLILLLFKPFFYKLRQLSMELGNTTKDVSHHINESLIGIKTLKAFGAEKAVASKSYSYFEILRKIQLRTLFLSGVKGTLFEPASLIFISILFAYSYKIPGFDVASFAVIVYLIQKMFSFIQGIQSKLDNLNSAFPRLKSMLIYQTKLEEHQEKYSGDQPFEFKDALTAQGVSFSYPGTEFNVLDNISFSVKKGEMIGIIGPSGAGKTTLVDILLRLFKPQNGSIKIDGADISSIILDDWRRNIGYVSQDVFLLNDTVEGNIRLYDSSVSQADVEQAAKMANIYTFIQELPDKFETSVGERGVKLSGGQRQRISLARVLAKKPAILILDEATSALDNESEAMIQKAINDLKGKITVLVIAHRLSTVMNSDKLIVLNKGNIVETGTPDELIQRPDSYLYKSYHAVKS